MSFKLEDRQKNTDSAYELSRKALEYAKRRLKSDGLEYPCLGTGDNIEENYIAIRRYAEKEAGYVKEYLAHYNRKVEVDKPIPVKPDWKAYRAERG